MKILTGGTPICRIAAETFEELWRKCTGTKLEIVREDDGVSDFAVIGNDAENFFAHESIMQGVIPDFELRSGAEGYRIVSSQQKSRRLLFLAGGRPRALLYAVYRFFELRADCAYFWDGDRIPRSENIDCDALDVMEEPRFSLRGLRYFAHRSLKRFQAEQWTWEDWKRELDWIVKKRLNFFMLRIGQDDLFQVAFPAMVAYPDSYTSPDEVPRTYNDRTLFWPLKFRGELRKKILSYAFERDLLHPEDCGTMSHWYSPTAHEFLEKAKPEFMPQVSETHGEPKLRVFDIRKDENLEYYFQLTRAHIEHYGAPRIFHTIGLAERSCYLSRKENFTFKLYAYRRIIERLRREWPDAPLLVSSWEFCAWTLEEIQSFIRTLDPSNTLIFDYISETAREDNVFTNWNIVGRFPWVFGIFHAFERDNDMRGNYDIIARRLPVAAGDPMCRGMVFWPEVSHSDTLMLEFFSALTWNPEHCNIDDFLPEFCRARYGARKERFLPVWKLVLPVACWCGFHRNEYEYSALNLIGSNDYGNLYTNLTPENIVSLKALEKRSSATLASLPEIFRMLSAVAAAGVEGEFEFRDLIDLARVSAARLHLAVLTRMTLMCEAWRDGAENQETITALLELSERALTLLSSIVGTHEDFSLRHSLDELEKNPLCNPEFEPTLKGNAENNYCRSWHIYELDSSLLLPEFRVFASWIKAKLAAVDRSPWRKPVAFEAEYIRIADAFYAVPLRKLAPDRERLRSELPQNLETLAELSMDFLKQGEKK